jgi:hypothetical protein
MPGVTANTEPGDESVARRHLHFPLHIEENKFLYASRASATGTESGTFLPPGRSGNQRIARTIYQKFHVAVSTYFIGRLTDSPIPK